MVSISLWKFLSELRVAVVPFPVLVTGSRPTRPCCAAPSSSGPTPIAPTFKKFILRLNQDKNFKLFGKLLQTEYIKNIYNYKVEIYKFEENPHENICKKYDLKYKLVHELNRNRNKKIKDYYDNELIYIVNNIFEDDFTYLNYKMVPNISELNF